MHQIVSCELRQYIYIALYHGVLCNDAYGVPVIIEYLQQLPCDTELSLAGLVAVCIAGEEHGLTGPFAVAEILAQ